MEEGSSDCVGSLPVIVSCNNFGSDSKAVDWKRLRKAKAMVTKAFTLIQSRRECLQG